MGEVALGSLTAFAGSSLFSVGLVLQSLEARRMPGDVLRAAAMLRLLVRPLWLAGGALMLVGYGFHVGSLALAPLTVVQPSLSAGLLTLLVLSRRTDAIPFGARELAAVGTITAGLVGITLTAPERATVTAGTGTLALALGALALVALLPLALAALAPPGRRAVSLAAAFGAAAAYSLTGVTTKLVSDGITTADWPAAALWLALTAVAGAVALVDQTTALHRRAPTQVGTLVHVVPVIVPVLLAPVLFGEDWGESPLSGLPLALSLTAACAGAAALARIAVPRSGRAVNPA
jgi:hypothetical protein